MSFPISFAGQFFLCLALAFASNFAALGQSSARLSRGTGTNFTYKTYVIPLDGQQGTTNAPPLTTTLTYFGVSTLYHLNATNTGTQTYITNRLAFTNAVAAYGGKYGGTPLYFGQAYHFGAYGGDPVLTMPARTNAFLITWTDKTSGTFVGGVELTVPSPLAATEW